MTMQLKSIILYNANGEQRFINFRLNSVNIITGQSKTGKSSIINIIDYCLGRSTFQVAAGIIRDSVEWYAVLYQLHDMEVLIAKPKPDFGQNSQSQVYYEIAPQIAIPNLPDLRVNSTDDAVSDELSRRLNISPNLNIPPEGQTREPLQANIKHTKHYLFQPQSVIANRDVLFYRQNEQFIPQAIKDTILYFLGVIQEDRLQLLSDLNAKKRELRLARRNLEEVESYTVERANRRQSLVIEARQVGLIEPDVTLETPEAVTEIFATTRNWQPTIVPPVIDDLLSEQQEELAQFRQAFQEKLYAIEAAEAFVHSADGYTIEAAEQIDRLASINLFDEDNGTEEICPICGANHSQQPPSVAAIRQSLENLHRELSTVNREKPELDNHIRTLKDELEQLRVLIQQKELDLQAVIEEQAIAQQYRDTNARIAHVVGRISYYLDVTPETDDEASDLRKTVEQLEGEVRAIEDQLDTSIIEDRKSSILNIIGTEMTRLSGMLELEHEGPYRLDLNRLTVVADRPDVPIVMDQNMGSAANHLGSHLITLLALHKYFLEQTRPVPSFLILDQPTQVYFPPEVYEQIDQPDFDMADEDRIAVSRMFDLLFEVSRTVGLQIIVLDHANLDNEEFQEAIIEGGPWRDGNALIPESWL
ncbi:MAG: hypothetical protein CL610_16505 [Anaerolineaceae bacterium]|nr:hypothetical protein [Anaerolineaceae bacterium]